ncbi:MAG: NfeD family protein [Luteolibacter sp.]|jgi:membrane-bound serine protease (ClpP class)|nr:NfeD family protein [Luteolibacter sp.]
MTWIILLFFLGILFLSVEVIVPGGILGTIGGLMMFGGCVMAFIDYGSGGGMLAVTLAVALTILAFFIEFRILPRTSVGRRAFLTREITAVSAAFGDEARDLIGKSAEALTMLSPSGYIMIEGKRYEAFCQSGQVPAGAALEVTGADNFRLIVSETKNK